MIRKFLEEWAYIYQVYSPTINERLCTIVFDSTQYSIVHCERKDRTSEKIEPTLTIDSFGTHWFRKEKSLTYTAQLREELRKKGRDEI